MGLSSKTTIKKEKKKENGRGKGKKSKNLDLEKATRICTIT
jgi:hypothetical protein